MKHIKKTVVSLILSAVMVLSAVTPAAGEVVCGDVNGDGWVDIGDACNLLKYIAGWQNHGCIAGKLDLYRDGEVNLNDVVFLLKYLANWDVGRFCHDDTVEYKEAVGVDAGYEKTTCILCGDTVSQTIPAPVSLDEKSEAFLRSADETVILSAADGGLKIVSLYLHGSRNEYIGTPSEFSLPQFVEIAGRKTRIAWEFEKITESDGTDNGTEYKTVDFHYTYGNSLELTVSAVARHSLNGPFEFRSVIKNSADDEVRIIPEKFASFEAPLEGQLISVKKESGYAEGYKSKDGIEYNGSGIYSTDVKKGANVIAWTNVYQNYNVNGYLPMIYQVTERGGLYCALEWSSGRVTAAAGDTSVRFAVDMDYVSENNDRFSTLVNPGDEIALPSVYIGAFDGSLDNGSNIFKRWFFECKAPSALRDNPMEPLSQMDMQTGVETYGVESIKWDYGWWSSEESVFPWKTLEGSWILRSEAYKGVLAGYGCNGLPDFGELCKSKGLNWTAYVLLHDTLDSAGRPTDEFGEFNSLSHPEWFSNRVVSDGMGQSCDLGNEECVEYLKTAMADFFKTNGINTWRSDFEPICYSSDLENRHDSYGDDVMYWCTVGFNDLLSSLYENVPGFRYECCSSGGGLKDLNSARYAVSINTDDSGQYLGMRMTFYDSSYVIHPAQLQFPCNVDLFNPGVGELYPEINTTAGEDFDLKKTMLDMGMRSMILGSPMFSTQSVKCEKEYYEKYSRLYAEKIRPIIREGDLYHILPRPNGVDFDGVMYSAPYSASDTKGVVFLFKPTEAPGDICHITLDGLRPDKEYSLSFTDRPEQNMTASGETLMTDGVDVVIEYIGSELIFITEHQSAAEN